jgi:hypothetical protein
MAAASMPEKAQALARAMIRLTNADVVEFAEPKAMNGEPTAAHVARYLAKCVVRRLFLFDDAQHSRRGRAGRHEQYDRTGWFRILLPDHLWIMGIARNPDNANRRVRASLPDVKSP